MVFTFDAASWEYATAEDLEKELDACPQEFFSKPCAYYDMVMTILGKVRTLCADSIIVYSPQVDECSRLATEFLYNNFIRHFVMYNSAGLDINYSAPACIPRPVKARNPFKGMLHRFSFPILDILGLNPDPDDSPA